VIDLSLLKFLITLYKPFDTKSKLLMIFYVLNMD